MARTRTAPKKKADEHAADPKEAAAAVDKNWEKASAAVEGKKAPTPRTDAKTLKLIVKLREEEGLGVVAIARELEKRGIKTATGKTKWHGPAIRQMLVREMGDEEWTASKAARKAGDGSAEHDAAEKSGQ